MNFNLVIKHVHCLFSSNLSFLRSTHEAMKIKVARGRFLKLSGNALHFNGQGQTNLCFDSGCSTDVKWIRFI